MLECLFVGIGGFIGSVCRYLIGLIPVKVQSGFPVKTLCINVLGAFLISLIVAYAAKSKAVNPQLVLMLKVGVCGGFTTFSTFAYESVELFKGGHTLVGLGYIVTSVIFGVFAVYAGELIVNKI